MIENLSDEPLSLLAFSSRPRVPGLPADQIMSAWAQWIATSRQGIIVEPHSTWRLNPQDLDRLPSFHGHTWISIFFSHAKPNLTGGLPATVLPPTFNGRFRVYYCFSPFRESQIATPPLSRRNLVRPLQYEVDPNDKAVTVMGASDIAVADGLAATELH
jgi:hypothetical protein